MDRAYENARQRKARLQQEIEKIDQFLVMYEEFSNQNGLTETAELQSNIRPANVAASTTARAVFAAAGGDEPRAPVRDNPKPAEVIREVCAILEEKGRPQTRRQLLEALRLRNIYVRGTDPMKVLGTNLWRAEGLEQHDGLGYWFKGRPLVPPEFPLETYAASTWQTRKSLDPE